MFAAFAPHTCFKLLLHNLGPGPPPDITFAQFEYFLCFAMHLGMDNYCLVLKVSLL